MEKLKIGDKLYRKEEMKFSDSIRYTFATVERLTKTQAILSNGVKLINEPKEIGYWSPKIIGYEIYGDKWETYHFSTPEIIQEANKERKKRNILNWFDNKKFTFEEKEIIYNQLKKPE